jgi:glycosyltransferase involved in cell wall biosynthesis
MQFDFTVITPTLNAELYLMHCIHSVSEQKKISIQHIVVDGGSNDRTVEICKKSGVIFLSAPGMNIYQSLNIGINNSKSKYVCFLNADDYYPDDQTLFRVEQQYCDNSDAEIVYGDCRFVDTDGRLLYIQRPQKSLTLRKALAGLYIIPHPSTFFKREVFKKFGYYNEDIAYSSDCEYIIRLIKGGCKLLYFNNVLSVFRRHSSNLSDTAKSGEDWIKITSFYNRRYNPILHKIAYLFLNIHNVDYLFYLVKRMFRVRRLK